MYDARSVCNFFLDRSQEQRVDITALGLLKILYFSHAWHLARFDKPLVGQPFEAWKHGPVCRVAYDQLRKMGANAISKRLTVFSIDKHEFIVAEYEFSLDTNLFLCNTFDYYAKFHPYKLSDLTHEEGSPWDQVWKVAALRAVPGMVIPNDLIRDWFRATKGVLGASGERSTLS